MSLLTILYAFLPVYHNTIVGTILAIPLIFVLPGYAMTEVLFRQQQTIPAWGRFGSTDTLLKRRTLTNSDRFILSLSLSIVVDIGSGFILNLLPIGLHAVSWAVFLSLLTIVLVLLALLLRLHKYQTERSAQPSVQASEQVSRTERVNFRALGLFWLALVVALFSLLYSAFSADQQPRAGFTQLSIVPPTQSEQQCVVQLSVRSFEATSVSYRLNLSVNGKTAQIWASIVLAPHQQWNQAVQVVLNPQEDAYVKAELYRLDRPETVYRSVNLLLRSVSAAKSGAGHCST